MRYEIILNPNAGNKPKEGINHLLKHHLKDFIVSETKKSGDATKLAKKSKADIIVAAGGDGTVNEVINGVLQRKKKVPVGIIPVGTANMLARYLKIPMDPDEAISCLKEDYTRAIDVGMINDRYFLNGAGIGFDAESFKNVEPQLKKLFGSVAYPVAGFKTLFKYEPKELRIQTKELDLKGYFVIVCNLGKYGPIVEVVPKASIEDGKLDVLVFQKKDIYNTLRFLMGMVTKGHTLYEGVIHLQTKQLQVTSEEEVLYHVDAEVAGNVPVKIRVKHKAVDILCPDISDPKELLSKGISAIEDVVGHLKTKSTKKLKRAQRKRKVR